MFEQKWIKYHFFSSENYPFFTAVNYCSILHGHGCVMIYKHANYQTNNRKIWYTCNFCSGKEHKWIQFLATMFNIPSYNIWMFLKKKQKKRFFNFVLILRKHVRVNFIKVIRKQWTGTRAIRWQIQPSKPRWEITKITNRQDATKTNG